MAGDIRYSNPIMFQTQDRMMKYFKNTYIFYAFSTSNKTTKTIYY